MLQSDQQKSIQGAPQARPIHTSATSEGIPISLAQQQLWFFDAIETQHLANHIFTAWSLRGRLEISVLTRCFHEIIKRHQTLRTAFRGVDGVPHSILVSDASLPLVCVDLRAILQGEREGALRHLSREASLHPFALDHAPLLRIVLVRVDDKAHALLMTAHHIIFDLPSVDIFMQELVTLYADYAQGNAASVPALPVQYTDFAAWQRVYLQGAGFEEQVTYWKQQLRDSSPLLPLPTDRPRTATRSFRGATQPLTLPASLVMRIRALGHQEKTTLFSTLLAAYQVLLFRYCGQHDIAIGYPDSGRTRAELESLIGCFTNMLVLRTDLAGAHSFRELLARTHIVVTEALSHRLMPFEKLIETLQPERNRSYSPLFQVIFAFQHAPSERQVLPDLTFEQIAREQVAIYFDLALELKETSRGLDAAFTYNSGLFDAATIARLMSHWQTLLAAIVENPDQPVATLPLLAEDEWLRMIVEWNKTETAYQQDQCIHQIFESQVQRTPEAIALVAEEAQLTYAGLNRRANQLAWYLRGLGVGPETIVGLCVERSPLMLVGLLGILKAGGAYLPIDPAYPEDRVSFMLQDAGISVLLGQRRLIAEAGRQNIRVVSLDSDWMQIDRHAPDNPDRGGTAENLAYVIYTSGSTGQPKAVLLQHRGLCNLVEAQRQIFQVQAHDRILQVASLSFDASIWEIVMAFQAGATLCLGLKTSAQTGMALTELLHTEAITTVTLSPSVLATLPASQFPALRRIITAGEACSAELVARWSPGRRFFNAYGPSEGTVCATVAECSDRGRTPPIGHPITNTRVYVLDRRLQPLPIGIPGELFIESIGLARGYLNRPELTAERFIPHPFSRLPGKRLYRTGDLVRYLPDGNLEFLGRGDQQIKIRGFRIEPAEVEAVLEELSAIQESFVLAREDMPGDRRLVAYVIARSTGEIRGSELRTYLKSKLPEYMLPSAFVFLEALPLTSNGKVNRDALPAPAYARDDPGHRFISPRNPVEEIIAHIWKEMLGSDQVGIDDTFFSLGGHSLLATQMLSRLHTTFQVELSLRQLFEQLTVAALADALVASEATPGRVAAIASALKKINETSPEDIRKELLSKKRKKGPDHE